MNWNDAVARLGRLSAFVQLGVAVVVLAAFGLPAMAQTTTRGSVDSVSPSQVAQFYPRNSGSFTMFVSISQDFAVIPSSATVGGVNATVNPTPGPTFASLTVPSSVTNTVGNKAVIVCGLNPLNNQQVCTDPSTSQPLQVIRSSVTELFPEQITQGASDTTLFITYLSERGDGPETNPTVFLVDSDGNETSLGQASFFSIDEGFPGRRFIDINIPESELTETGTFRLRVSETYDVGSPTTTDPTVAQAELEIVPPAQFVTESPLPPLILNQAGQTRTIEATGGVPIDLEGPLVYNYFQVGGQVPTGMFLSGSFSEVATLSGTPTVAGIFTFDVEVSDDFDVAVQKTYRIGVQDPNLPALSFPGTTLSAGRVGEFYFGIVQATGGTGSYTYAINGRPLPPGLTLDPSGFISGQPSQAGTFTVDIRAEDTQLRQVTSAFQIQILPPFPPLVFLSNATLPNGRVGDPYSFQFQSTGGSPPYAYILNETSVLPPGLSLTQGGLLAGDPLEEGTYQFEVIVLDSRSFEQGPSFASAPKVFTLTILPPVPPPSFVTAVELPPAEAGSPYEVLLETQDGVAPIQIIIPFQILPPGLTVNSSTGLISGVPTSSGEWEFLARARDARGQEGSRLFRLVIRDQVAPLSITTTSPLPEAGLNETYSTSIVAAGGVPPYQFSVTQGALPPGLVLNSGSGVISGTPTQIGNFTFTVRVGDSEEGEATREFTLPVVSSVRLITESPLPNGSVGQPYSQTIVAGGGNGNYQFSVINGSLPSGISLNASTGVLSGTPTSPFSGQFTVRVTDTSEPPGAATRVYNLRIRQPLELTVLQLPVGTREQPYSLQFGAQGGEPPYSFSLASGTLPEGLSLSPSGLLSGTPVGVSVQNITVRVTDSQQDTAQRSYTLEIRAPQVSGGSLSLSTTVGVSNTQNEVDVTLSSAQEEMITGTVTLSVNSNVNPPVDDPTIQFISGGRTASFTIPAGQTSAQFGNQDTARFQTGTTAATLVFTATFQRDGEDATPSPAPQATLSIPVTPPTISSLNVTRSGNNLTVVVVGFAPERNITTAMLEFTRRPGAPGNNPERFDVNVAQAFQQWFSSAASQPFGSQFRLTIPVTLTGDPADITGLTVRLAGPAGTGNSTSATF